MLSWAFAVRIWPKTRHDCVSAQRRLRSACASAIPSMCFQVDKEDARTRQLNCVFVWCTFQNACYDFYMFVLVCSLFSRVILFRIRTCSIGIKHGISCINIRQVPWEVLKTEAGETMFDRYYCIKTENICYISRYFLHYFISPFHRCLAISKDYAHSRAGQYTSRNGSKSVAPVRSY